MFANKPIGFPSTCVAAYSNSFIEGCDYFYLCGLSLLSFYLVALLIVKLYKFCLRLWHLMHNLEFLSLIGFFPLLCAFLIATLPKTHGKLDQVTFCQIYFVDLSYYCYLNQNIIYCVCL